MTTELLTLIVLHFACSDAAQTRHLSLSEAQECSAAYETIKISFVPGVTHADYRHLTDRERIAVSQEGFLSFLKWREDHPEMVRHLEAVARGEEELASAG